MNKEEVSLFIENLDHPRKSEIMLLREIILSADNSLIENIKWNAPNYSIQGEDRLTMRINPPKHLQLIFHRGAKVLEMPKERIIHDDSGLLAWKTNDRAVASFKDMEDLQKKKESLVVVINKWIQATVNL